MKIILLILFCFPVFVMAQLAGHYISGTVINRANNESIKQGIVRISSAKTGVFTDDKGHYKLAIPDSLIGKKVILEYKYVGFITIEYTLYIDTVKIMFRTYPLFLYIILQPAKRLKR